MPTPPYPPGSYDKVKHFIAYAGLFWWFAQTQPSYYRKRLALGLFALGLLIEILQPITHRTFDLWDLLANAIGIAIAWIVIWAGLTLTWRALQPRTKSV